MNKIVTCRILLPFVLILSISDAFGQFNFRGDKNFKYRSDSLLQTIGINHPDFTKVDFELRYWIEDIGQKSANEIYVLEHYKNKAWHLSHYQVCPINDKYEIVSFHDFNLVNFDDLWKKLVVEQILSLPTESTMKKDWKSSLPGKLVIEEGQFYAIELATEKTKREYSCSNPKAYMEFYNISNNGLHDFINVIDTLDRLFEYKKSDVYNCL